MSITNANKVVVLTAEFLEPLSQDIYPGIIRILRVHPVTVRDRPILGVFFQALKGSFRTAIQLTMMTQQLDLWQKNTSGNKSLMCGINVNECIGSGFHPGNLGQGSLLALRVGCTTDILNGRFEQAKTRLQRWTRQAAVWLHF